MLEETSNHKVYTKFKITAPPLPPSTISLKEPVKISKYNCGHTSLIMLAGLEIRDHFRITLNWKVLPPHLFQLELMELSTTKLRK